MRSLALPAALVLLLGLAAAGVGLWVESNEDAAGSTHASGASGSTHAKVLFADDFNGSRLDRSRWNTCYWWNRRGCTISSNHELEWYLPRQARVRNGALSLVAAQRRVHASNGHKYDYASGMISSGPAHYKGRSKFAFHYGQVTIRAKTPSGRGLWPAFWMLPASGHSLPEIDLMEKTGERPGRVEMYLHYRGAGGAEKRRGAEWSRPALRSGWHTYSVDWSRRRLVWLVDGKPRFRIQGRVVPHQRMYLLANLAVGGDAPGPPSSSTRFPSRYQIDSIKVTR